MKAVVLAAGKGQRLGRERQKVMEIAYNRPLLSYVLEGIRFIPQKDTVIVTGYDRDSVINGIGGDYRYIIQEEQKGTGHAVACTAPVLEQLKEDILICYGDMPLLSQATYEGVIREHQRSGADCTILTARAPNLGLHYGRILRENGVFTGVIEHRDCSEEQKKTDELNVGIYVFNSTVLFPILRELTTDNVPGEYYLTDAPRLLMKRGGTVNTYTIYNSNEIYGVNTPEELAFCENILKNIQPGKKEITRTQWFGTGGWRAIIGEDFIKSNICMLAQAIARHMVEKGYPDIVVGFDRRFLSEKSAMWISEVFAANGITVYFINKIAPTPLIMFTVKNSKAKYGIAITASHNPAEYNGIKVFTEGGRDASTEVTDIFEDIMAQGVTVTSTPFNQGVREGKIRIIDPNNDYIDSVISMIDMEAIRKGNLRILLDPMFGVSKTTLQTILMTARCDVDIINNRHDTLFGGRLPSPTARTLTKLRDQVTEQRYHLGIATDGDADRIGVIDHEGRFVHPNELLVLLYYYLMHYKGLRGDCVRNISTTHILDKIAGAYGQKCHEVPVGFKYISMKMEETDAIIGGESSGGFTIRGHIRGKDGIFASALIIEMLSVTGKNIPQLLEEIGKKFGARIMTEFDTSFTMEKKVELIELLFTKKRLPAFETPVQRVSYEDGCKVYFENDGWVIARFSGTEPLIRIFCEMETKEEADHITDIMVDFLGLTRLKEGSDYI